ncbi:MAG: AMP-binding protein [Streptosporangiaceae bacterium]
MTVTLSVDDRIRSIAAAHPRRPAVIGFDDRDREQVLTWSGLERESADRAKLLPRRRGAALIALDAPNRVETVIRILACLRGNLPPLPLDPKAPPAERDRLLQAAGAAHVVHVWTESSQPTPASEAGPEPRGPAGYLLATGGSSGSPRVIAHPGPVSYDRRRVPNPLLTATGWTSGQRQMVVGPLHHAAPFTACLEGLLDANTIVLQDVFRPRSTVRLIAEHAVEWVQLTPTHMQWMAMAIEREQPLPPSLRAMVHTAAPCPETVKREWIALLGPSRVFEFYAATENIGTTLVRGDEWLRHPGTVGRGFCTQIRILDSRGRPAPSVGEIYMRKGGFSSDAAARSAAVRRTADGFSSVGDYGWLDGERYLFLSPRREDMVLVGGANVYPAEVEAALLEHPEIGDCAVIGVPDEQVGSQLAAFVVRRPGAGLDERAVRSFCAAHLSPHKIPQSVDFIDQVPRSESGKLHRRRLHDMARTTRTPTERQESGDG